MGEGTENRNDDLTHIFAAACQKTALVDAKIEQRDVNAMRPVLALLHRLDESGFPAQLTRYERTSGGGYLLSINMKHPSGEEKDSVPLEHKIILISQNVKGSVVLARFDPQETLPFPDHGSMTNIADQAQQKQFAAKLVELTALKLNLYKKAQKVETVLSAQM